jgi:hypothetical protein
LYIHAEFQALLRALEFGWTPYRFKSPPGSIPIE